MKLRSLWVVIFLILWLSAEWRCRQLRHRLADYAAVQRNVPVNVVPLKVVYVTNPAPVIEPEPTSAEGYNKRGLAKEPKFDLNGAIADFTKGIELNPNDASGYYTRGVARLWDDLNGAIADYSKAIEIKPDWPYSYKERGYALSLKSNWDGAIADYTKTVELMPNFLYAYELRGEAKKAKGDLAGAATDFAKAKESNPAQQNPK
jgi:tetratricopeptide (TPR) repeat protein